jgi:hypothetical protein
MGDVLPFRAPAKKSKSSGKTLCKSGFHKWLVDKEQRFDVKQGKLITVVRCERCGVVKSKAT